MRILNYFILINEIILIIDSSLKNSEVILMQIDAIIKRKHFSQYKSKL